jgi:hypothetical protein
MMVMRECVARHHRLPQTIVVDGGKEFQSAYFETLLARYECIKKQRPPAKARFGSVCERLFGTTESRFIYNLIGNTQMTKSDHRLVTKAVNPRNLAAWTYEALAASKSTISITGAAPFATAKSRGVKSMSDTIRLMPVALMPMSATGGINASASTTTYSAIVRSVN